MIKHNWRNLILEMLMVMIGVFLALFVDEWREERQIAKIVEPTEERVLSEISENHSQLTEYQSRLNDRFEQLQNWGTDLQPGLSFREQNRFPGIPTVTLSDAAWQRANSSDMTNFMETETMEQAYGLYLANARVLDSYEPLFDLIYSPLSWDKDSTLVSYNIAVDIFKETISQVSQSLEGYDEFTSLVSP
jgi:hypothetical protein